MEGPVLVLSHEEWSPGEWGLYCYALLFSTTQHLVFNIPFNIILLIFSAPFFHFSLSLTQGMGRGTLLLRSIIFNNPTPLFNIPFNISFFFKYFQHHFFTFLCTWLGEWGLYCYALLFSTTQQPFFNIPFNIFLLIFSAPFFHFSLSLTWAALSQRQTGIIFPMDTW